MMDTKEIFIKDLAINQKKVILHHLKKQIRTINFQLNQNFYQVINKIWIPLID